YRSGGQAAGDAERGRLRRRRPGGLDDGAVVAAVGRLERYEAAVVAVAAQVPGRAVQVLPAGLGELRGVRDRPQLLAHAVRTGPWGVRLHQAVSRVGQRRVRGVDQVPVDQRGHPGVDVAPVERTG